MVYSNNPNKTCTSLLKLVIHIVRCCKRLRHCATNRKVVGYISSEVIRIFHWFNPSGRTVALGSTQPPSEMSTRVIFWEVMAADARDENNLTTFMWQLSRNSNILDILKTQWPVQACNAMALLLYTHCELLHVSANHLTFLREAKHKNEYMNGMYVCIYVLFLCGLLSWWWLHNWAKHAEGHCVCNCFWYTCIHFCWYCCCI
jgi:hypothetical protein